MAGSKPNAVKHRKTKTKLSFYGYGNSLQISLIVPVPKMNTYMIVRVTCATSKEEFVIRVNVSGKSRAVFVFEARLTKELVLTQYWYHITIYLLI